MNEVILTQTQLEERLAYWKEKLSLRDWNLKVIKASQEELGEYKEGWIGSNIPHKAATIKILHEEHYFEKKSEWFEPFDMEHVLVHELMHLHTQLINKKNDEDDLDYCLFEEWAIESVVSALISLERK